MRTATRGRDGSQGDRPSGQWGRRLVTLFIAGGAGLALAATPVLGVAALALPLLVLAACIMLAMRGGARRPRAAFSVLALGVTSLAAAALLLQWACWRRSAALYDCGRNLNALYLATLRYATDHGNRYPQAAHWVDDLSPYVKSQSVFRCPADPTTGRSSYSMNRSLSGRSIDGVETPDQTVYLYEPRASGANPNGRGEDQPAKGRHRYPGLGSTERIRMYLFADGHMCSSDSASCPKPRW